LRPRFLAVLAASLMAAAAGPANASTYGDTLTVIWRPLPNLPVLVRPGDNFTVWANAPSGSSDWTASLTFGALSIPLAPAGGGYQASRLRWELDFQVPQGVPEEIYDLTLQSGASTPDTSRHSVKVLPAFRTSYYFAQISDTHLPEHGFSSDAGFNPADTSGMGDFDAVIEDLNVIHPEFIIHTGDLVNEGELEEYLGMYEMGRAQAMLSRLRDPIFVSSGNHDQGGWQATPPPDGTARRNWWRYFGWPFLGNPPAGDPYHSQDYHFDYGPLHVIGLEAYINNGSYDHYMQNIWGAQSFTAEQMNWLNADIAAAPPGSKKLLFYHYDFGGTLGNGQPGANFSQINPTALGLDGAIWGHNHFVSEGNLGARPFNLGIQAVIDGLRTFRIFRVTNGAMSPGPMHHCGGTSGTPTDSLTLVWSGPNDGTRSTLSATVRNRFGETWDHARLVFNMVDHDSAYGATGGTIAQTIRQGGRVNVYVDCTLPAGGITAVSVNSTTPIAGVVGPRSGGLDLGRPIPNPYRAGAGDLTTRFSLPAAGRASVELFDLGGRRVAEPFSGWAGAGVHAVSWDGRLTDGRLAGAGVYWVRLRWGREARSARFVVTD